MLAQMVIFCNYNNTNNFLTLPYFFFLRLERSKLIKLHKDKPEHLINIY